MSFLSKFFTPETNITKLKQFYMNNHYETIPYVSTEANAKFILSNKDTFAVLVPKEYMVAEFNGLLRGDIILLWWLQNPRTRKTNIPKYFEQMYGINANDEFMVLSNNKLIDENNQITELGENFLQKFGKIIDQHRAKKAWHGTGPVEYMYSNIIKDPQKKQAERLKESKQQIRKSLKNLKDNGFTYYIIISSTDDPEIAKNLNNRPFRITDAKIGVNCPPFSWDDTSSIAAKFIN